MCGFNWLWWILQKERCLWVEVFRVPCLFLGREHGLVLLDVPPSSSGKGSFSFLSCWGFCTLFFKSAVAVTHWIAAWHLIWIVCIMSCGRARWSVMSRACLHDTLDALIFHTLFIMALRLLPGEIPGTGCCGVQCHEHPTTSLCPQWWVPAGPPQKWHTVGIFLLWMLMTLADNTDVGRALSLLESRVRIQNVG